ncbi:MAG: hypothetical protein ACUVSD_05335 [Thiobacillaceae bacterium]
MRCFVPIALLAVVSVLAQAQMPEHAAYPRLEYRPALADYAPYRETGLDDWRAANERVGRLGGHMGHARMPAGGHHHDQDGRDAFDSRPAGGPAGERP